MISESISLERRRERVSVVIPHFNQNATLARAITSIATELRPGDEVIVVDDASVHLPDLGSLDLDGPALRLEAMPVNGGAAAARNRGVALASNDIVCFLDGDDQCLPGRISAQVATLDGLPAAVAVVGDFELERAGLAAPAASIHGKSPEAVRTQILSGYMFAAGSTLTVRRAAFLAAGGYDRELRMYEDWDLLLRLMRDGLVAHCGRIVARVAASSRSPDPQRRSEALQTVKSRHLSAGRDGNLLRQALAYERASMEFQRGNRVAAILALASAARHSPISLARRLIGRVLHRRA